jgi:hypothetical protein
MTSAINTMFTGLAGAGLTAPRAIIARASDRGTTLPTFHRLRS